MNPNQDAENDRAVMTLVRSQGTEFKVSMQQCEHLTEVLGSKTGPRLPMQCAYMLMHKPSPPDVSVISVADVRNYLDGVDRRFANVGDTCHDTFYRLRSHVEGLDPDTIPDEGILLEDEDNEMFVKENFSMLFEISTILYAEYLALYEAASDNREPTVTARDEMVREVRKVDRDHVLFHQRASN